MVDHQPPHSRILRRRTLVKGELQVHAGTRPGGGGKPCVKVDEHGPCELSVLVDGIARYIVRWYGELDDACRPGSADSARDENGRVVEGLHMWCLWWIQWCAVKGGAVQCEGLQLVRVHMSLLCKKNEAPTYKVIFETNSCTRSIVVRRVLQGRAGRVLHTFVEISFYYSVCRCLKGIVDSPKGRTSRVAHAWSTMTRDTVGFPVKTKYHQQTI